MTTTDAGQHVTVSCRECRCPGTPGAYHERDEVYLAREPSLDLAMGAQFVLEDAQEEAAGSQTKFMRQVLRGWTKVYIREGVVGWNLVDAEGAARPLDIDEILADISLALPTADEASTHYTEKLLRPLGLAPAVTSPTGRTVRSKSRTKGSTGTPPEQSSPATLAASPR